MGQHTIKEQTTPANPPSGYLAFYPKADGHFYILDSGGTETQLLDETGGAVPSHGSNHVGGGSDAIPVATGSVAGLMSASDKGKLDGVETNADVTDATNVNAAGAVMESDFDANTMLAATTDDTPVPLTVNQSTIVGRKATGPIAAMSPGEARTVLNVEDGAQVNTVTSVHGRTGAVTSAQSDYDASQIDNDSGVSGAYVHNALDTLNAAISAVSSGYSRRAAVIDYVDCTLPPPTEVSGDRYILDFTVGTVHASWDGASKGDIVQFSGSIWEATTPEEGWISYVDTQNKDALYVDDGTPDWELRPVYNASHADLTDVSANQHHNQVHGSADHSGNIGTASQISDFDTEVSNNTDVDANTTHRTSNGTDHTYIDQDVRTTAKPTFDGANMTDPVDHGTGGGSYDGELLYHSGNVKYGARYRTGYMQVFARTGATVALGELSDSDGSTFTSGLEVYGGTGSGGLWGLPVYTTLPSDANVSNGDMWFYFDGSDMWLYIKHANNWYAVEMGLDPSNP